MGDDQDCPIRAAIASLRRAADWDASARMFHRAIRGKSLPKYLSSDHDPLYRFHQWQANLRVLEVTEIPRPVRRILGAHYRPESDSAGPSWLTSLGHTKDSLWSCDLFRCESATLRTH